MVGEGDSRISYLENIGNVTEPEFVWRTGDADPFDGMTFGETMINPSLIDLDGDGDFDLAVGDEAGSIQFYENVGSALLPEFVARVGSANPFDKVQVAGKSAPRFSDLDGDNDPDLVLGDETGRLTFYENKQQGKSFATPKFSEIAGTASPLGSVDVDLHETGAAYSAPALLDLEGDGDLDVVVGHRITSLDGVGELSTAELRTLADTDTLIFYENIGSAEAPEFVQRTGSGSPFGFVDARGYSAAAFGDMDRDGDVDLVLGEEGSLLYYENAGSPVTAFLARQAWANPLSPDILATGDSRRFEGLTYINPAFGDLDDDGDLDLIVSADSGTYYYENTGTAAFPIFNLTKGFFDDVVVDVGAPALVDLDDDGDLDLVVGNCTTPPVRTSGGSCYTYMTHEVMCDVTSSICNGVQGGYWYPPGYISSYGGCCLCDHGCDHSAETGTDCQSGYSDSFQSDGSCYDMFGDNSIECDVDHAACDAKGSGFYWYNPGFVGSSGCCHCYSSCNHNLETAADCTYYETGHPPTPSPSVSPKPSTSPTPGPTVSPTLGPTPKVVADAATATTVGVLAAGAAGVAALL